MKRGNLYRVKGPPPGPGELAEELYEGSRLTILRILSEGHATAPGFWYDQDGDEWVALLAGSAEIRFEDGTRLQMAPGDWVVIPAHVRHRVERTSANPRALWLAVHLGIPGPPAPGRGDSGLELPSPP